MVRFLTIRFLEGEDDHFSIEGKNLDAGISSERTYLLVTRTCGFWENAITKIRGRSLSLEEGCTQGKYGTKKGWICERRALFFPISTEWKGERPKKKESSRS